MKVYINFSVLIGLLLFSSITHGQTSYKKYVRQKSPFQIDTIFNKYTNAGLTNTSTLNHIWLTSLNSYYIDTTKNKINASAIPVYVPLKKGSLLNPYSATNQIIGALLPYGNYFPAPATYTQGAYTPGDIMYRGIPYGYSPYSTRTIGAPYHNYILPKF